MAAQDLAVQTTKGRWKKFLREVKGELKKVSWPNRTELASYTGVVFVSVVVVAVVIWVIDASFNQILRAIIK
ncbi:MAG: preprotein translocase subunit SecE [Negativicutes bacterium]|nr:preprotein translocase subunit SecE [Negativicutes bacterium]